MEKICKYCPAPATIEFAYKYHAKNSVFTCDNCREKFFEKLTEKNKLWYEEIKLK